MRICSNCNREMACSRTGVLVLFMPSHGYMGDEFECPSCKSTVVWTNASSFNPSPAHVEAKKREGRLLKMPGCPEV